MRIARGVLKFSSLPCSRLFSEVDSSLLAMALYDAFSEVFLVSTLKQNHAFHIRLVGRDRHWSPWLFAAYLQSTWEYEPEGEGFKQFLVSNRCSPYAGL